MPIQVQGNGGTVAEVDGTSFRAQRTVNRPLDHGSLGHYRASMQTGIMAAGLAANAEVFQFRWTHATNLCVIHKIGFEGMGSIAAFAAGVVMFRATIARAWSADGSGGTAATLTANNGKVRVTHGTSLLGSARVASTAALGAGTKTLDAVDVGAGIQGMTATAGMGMASQNLYQDENDEHPLVLATNEGIVIRATVPATGTWTGGFMMSWTELTAY